MYILYLLVLFSIYDYGFGVIFHLNDTEHARMPKLFELADYDACLKESHTYCLADFDLYGEQDNEIYTLIREYSKCTVKHYNYTRVTRGVCLETTCQKYIEESGLGKNEDLETTLEGCFNQTMKEIYNLSSRLHSINCDRPNEERLSIDIKDIFMGLFLISLCVVVIVGSYRDLYQIKFNEKKGYLSKGYQCLQCFSIFRNLEKLSEADKGDERLTELRGIDGIRVILEILVVYCHSYFIITKFTSNPHDFEKTYENIWFQSFYSYSSIVQYFFFISGFLMVYVMQIKEEKYKISWNHLPKILFLRWWRLTAPYAVVLGIMVSLYRYIGSGPLWKLYVVDGVSADCKKYYWAHIFYFNNFMIDDNMCAIESWHIATEMQLFVLGIIVYIYIRNKSWKLKTAILSFFILIGIVSPMLHVWLLDLDGLLLIKPEFFRTLYDETLAQYHVLFYNNLTCFFMGMANGYLIYYLKKNKMEIPNFKIGKILCWFVVPAICGVYYVGGSTFSDVEKMPLSWRLSYAALHRFVIGLIASVWILGTTLKFHGNSFAFLEWRGWLVPSKLTYCLYLIHDNVIHYIVFTRKELLHIDILDSFFVFVKLLFWSQVLALVLHLFVEAPASEVMKVFTQSKREKKKD